MARRIRRLSLWQVHVSTPLDRWILSLFASLVAACHTPMPTVAVEAQPDAIKEMAGRWEGTYESEENGRNGTMAFDLAAGGDTARGEVLMMPAWTGLSYQGSARGEPSQQRPVRPAVALPIRFVRIEHGQVLGTLDRYTDPDCGSEVSTTFIGSVKGDEAHGSFSIRGTKPCLASGKWRAHRVQPAAP